MRQLVIFLAAVAVTTACTGSTTSPKDEPPRTISTSTPPDKTTSRTLAGYMRAEEREYGFAGAVIVARGTTTLLREGYGWTGLGSGVPVEPETRFPLASVTKAFTATSVLLLTQRGSIRLDKSVCAYVPDCPQAWDTVSVTDLLRHTSGIPQLPPGRLEGARIGPVVGALKSEPLAFDPGSDYSYSNSNYIIAGFVVEQVTGGSWVGFLESNVLEPSGMTATGLDSPRAREVKGHTFTRDVDGALEPVSESFSGRAGHATIVEDAAGGLASNVDDLYRFARTLDEERLLSRRWLKIMWTPTGKARYADYGLGWESIDQLGTTVVQHGGGMPGFSSCLSLYPSESLYVIVLSNVQEMVTCEYVARDLAAITLGKRHHLPSAPDEDVDVPPAALRRLEGRYVPRSTLGSEGDLGDSSVTIRPRRSAIVMEGLAFVPPPFAQMTTLRPYSPWRFFNPQDPHVRVSFRRGSDGMQLVVHLPPYKRLPSMREVFVRLDP